MKLSDDDIARVKDCIEHYNRMIAWVKTQPKDDEPYPYQMRDAIRETWFGYYCRLCDKYISEGSDLCSPNCPLIKAKKGCNEPNSIWRKINSSFTWEDWLKKAERMRQDLKDLL